MSLLKVTNLWVRYENSNHYVLKGINLELRNGLVLIIGRTGCGKTTLARCLFGIIPHFIKAEVKGSIDILGVNPIDSGPLALAGKAAYVPQNIDMSITSFFR